MALNRNKPHLVAFLNLVQERNKLHLAVKLKGRLLYLDKNKLHLVPFLKNQYQDQERIKLHLAVKLKSKSLHPDPLSRKK